MLARIFGIILIVVGGSVALGALLPLIGSLVKLAFVLAQLLVAAALCIFGYRILTREDI